MRETLPMYHFTRIDGSHTMQNRIAIDQTTARRELGTCREQTQHTRENSGGVAQYLQRQRVGDEVFKSVFSIEQGRHHGRVYITMVRIIVAVMAAVEAVFVCDPVVTCNGCA